MANFNFQEKTVLVTGAARGTGRATVVALAEAGGPAGYQFQLKLKGCRKVKE